MRGVVTPFHLLSEIEIIQRAGDADLGHIRHCAVGIFGHAKPLQTANDLVALIGDKALDPHFSRPHTAFKHHKDGRIHNAVCQRRHRQHGVTIIAASRQNFSATGLRIQIFEDHAAVKDHGIARIQCRYLAERVDPANVIFRIHRIYHPDGDIITHTKAGQGNLDLAAKRGWRAGIQDHGRLFHCDIGSEQTV